MMDRLTSLPDEVAMMILSFLSVKSAVAATVLSRSWQHLWTQFTAFRITLDLTSWDSDTKHKVYADLFHQLIRVSWPEIHTIEVYIKEMVTNPLCALLPSRDLVDILDTINHGRNVKKIKVIFEKESSTTKYIMAIPHRVFERRSLETLEVCGLYLIDQVVTLPNLRELIITLYSLSSFSAFGNLVKLCPLLEILRVSLNYVVEIKDTIRIEAQKLKRLSINLDKKLIKPTNKIVLATPKLEYLEVNSPLMLKFCFIKTPIGLVKAKLFMGDGNPNGSPNPKQGLAIINPIFRVRTLIVSGAIVLALSFLECNVEVFHNLTHLEMGLICTRSWKGVKRFLQSCPNVVSLVFRKEESAIWDGNLSEIDILPECLHTKIHTIEMLSFDSYDKEFVVICYIFGVAKNLKMFHITTRVSQDNKRLNAAKKYRCHRMFQSLCKELPNCRIKISDELCFEDGEEIS